MVSAGLESELSLGEQHSGELWGMGSVEAAPSTRAELQPGCITGQQWCPPGTRQGILNSCTQELSASEAQTPISLGDKKAFHGTHQSDSKGAVLLKIPSLIIKL